MSSIGNIIEKHTKTVICNLESDVIDRILSGVKTIYLSAKTPKKPDWDGFVYFFDKQKLGIRARCTIKIMHIWDVNETFEKIAEKACIAKKNMLYYSSINYTNTVMVWHINDVTESSFPVPYKYSAVGWYYYLNK